MAVEVVAAAPGRTLSRAASRTAPAAVAAGAVAALGYLRVVSPYESGNYPTCPTLALTGLYCPGCGSLRALHELANLDVAGALAMNPLLLVAVPVLVVSWFLWARRTWTGRRRQRLAPPWALRLLLVVVVLHGVLRNVPAFGAWLAPGL
ncbi:DUF2752 domain-containing protein [Actinotalea sp. AC32]|nr:DUF2752 domain-containing protein [Actinotalea sp. AC32]